MEAVVSAHQAVAECAVIGVADDLKGQVAMGFVVLKAEAGPDTDAIKQGIVARVHPDIGPVAAFREVVVVDAPPKTRSGKILRKTMREIADGLPAAVPSTIEDPGVIDTLRSVLRISD